MSNRFKFRVWDKEENKMWYQRIIKPCGYEHIVFDYHKDEKNGLMNPIQFEECFKKNNRFILMQCVGIDDYNEKMLYEKDVVKVKIEATEWNKKQFGINKDQFRLATIVWDEESCGFKFEFEPNKKWHPCYNCFTFGSSEMYILGNIYENPELLK